MRRDVAWWLRVTSRLPKIPNSFNPSHLVTAIYVDLALIALAAVYFITR